MFRKNSSSMTPISAALVCVIFFSPLFVFSQVKIRSNSVKTIEGAKRPSDKIKIIQVEDQSLDRGILDRYFSLHSTLETKDWGKFYASYVSLEGVKSAIQDFKAAGNGPFHLSIKDTTTRFVFYDLNSRYVRGEIEKILRAGGNVEIVVDAQNNQLFEPVSLEEMERLGWSEQQKRAYYRQYDINRDGKVGPEDVEHINRFRYLGNLTFEFFEDLKKNLPKGSGKFVIKYLPERYVPESGKNFVFIMHAKSISTRVSRTGKIIQQVVLNANATANEENGRLQHSKENYKRYFMGENFSIIENAEPYLQVGLGLRGEIASALGREIYQYDNLAFSKLLSGETFNIAQEKNARTYRLKSKKDGSYIDFKFHKSYGNTKADLPWDSAINFMVDRNHQIEGIQSSQFVFTNTKFMQALGDTLLDEKNFRSKNLSSNDVNIVVNGEHGILSYSAMWQLFKRYRGSHGSPGMLTPFPSSVKTSTRDLDFNSSLFNNAFWIFHGKEVDVKEFGEEVQEYEDRITPVKNHAKVLAYKYVYNVDGETRYRIFVGSANLSNNAGKGTYEHMIEIDMANPSIYNQVKNHVSGTISHPRTQKFTTSYARLILYSLYKYPEYKFQRMDNETRKGKLPIHFDEMALEEFLEIYKEYRVLSLLRYLKNEAKESPMPHRTHDKRSDNLTNVGKRFINLLEEFKKNGNANFSDESFFQLLNLAVKGSKLSEKAQNKIKEDIGFYGRNSCPSVVGKALSI